MEGATRALTLTRSQGKDAEPNEELREAIRDAQLIAMAAAEEMVRQAKESSRGEQRMRLGDMVMLAAMGIMVLVIIGAAFATVGAIDEVKQVQRAQYREQLEQGFLLEDLINARTGTPRTTFPPPT